MADLEKVKVTHRDGETEESVDPPDEGPPARSGKNASTREPKNLSDVDDSGDGSLPVQNRGNPKVDGNVELKGQTTILKEQDVVPPEGDLCTKFYDYYHKEAGDYDAEFMKKHKGDIESTLIFAGLFSAVTSAFIVAVNSELKPGSDGETAALLRAILYNMNQTAFAGQDAPTTPPQWTSPPHAIVQVQAILYASLLASLLSAFLAMLGKQWLNRYVSVDMRGSVTERSQNRQRKLDGIGSWYFDYVMESLPLMLQAALLLFGCALSRYLWEIDTTVALVVVGVTSFGVLFYLFIVVAGATFVSCPYQTPGAHTLLHIMSILRRIPKVLGYIPDSIPRIPEILRHTADILHLIPKVLGYIPGILHHIPNIFRHILHIPGILHSALKKSSIVYRAPIQVWDWLEDVHRSPSNIPASLLLILLLPIWSVLDACRAVVWLLVIPSHWVYLRLQQESKRQAAMLDQRCISWTLQTLLDEPVRLSALNYLATITSTDLDPTLAVDCFNTLFGCIEVSNHRATTTQEFDQLVTLSALCCLHTLPHLLTTDPTPRILKVPHHRYTGIVPQGTSFHGLLVSSTFDTIDRVFQSQPRGYCKRVISWLDYNPSINEHIMVARAFVKVSRFEYRRGGREKVPRRFLRFALHSLSRSSSSQISVVIDCLSIIAIDLGCDSPTTTTLDERKRLDDVSVRIAVELEKMVEVADPNPIRRKRKAISALIPYAVYLARDKQEARMVDTFLRVAAASKPNSGEFIWHHIEPWITTLLDKPTTPSLNSVIMLASPHVDWHSDLDKTVVTKWAVIASATPYTEEVGQSVVDVLLQIASFDSLRQHIPGGIWEWLGKRPSLPPKCKGRSKGTKGGVVRHVRTRDVEILKSYLLLVWSEWNSVHNMGRIEMGISIKEDFNGIGMWSDRKDLTKRLHHVLEELDQTLQQHKPDVKPDVNGGIIRLAKQQYEELEGVILDVDEKAMKPLAQSHSTFACALPLPCL